ncbi:MAG TPA: 2-oxoglutarate dehydrogenase, partial [Flavobacteriaceae bacterium]|nr:2-oxoglutarate dehydrogenase [Flavobacteriaceae bacterium]
SEAELKTIKGSGLEGRITKEDILAFVKNRSDEKVEAKVKVEEISPSLQLSNSPTPTLPLSTNEGDEIIPMDRVRKIIADAMVNSKRTSPHVTSFIESDVTNVVKWRAKHKDIFEKREGEKLTFMPIFVKAVVKAIQDFPMINVSVDGDKIIKKKNINIGMATALPDGNLIVPVIKNADQLSLSGLAKAINDLAYRARNKKLRPEDTQGATYTISNVGTFGNLMGTPIIPQPQVAILAIGAIVKKPAVIETKDGDMIGIRQMMFMSHSYDHRVVDGSLGGMFLKHVHDYLQNWDMNTEI